MALFDDISKLMKGFVAPEADFTPVQSIPPGEPNMTPMPKLYSPLPPTEIKNTAPDLLGSILSGLISSENQAPGVDISADLIKLSSFAAVEAAIGAAEELAPSMAFIMSTLLGQLSERVLGPNLRDIEYQTNYGNPNRIVDLSTHIQAYFRGFLTKDEIVTLFRKEGYNEENSNILVRTATLLVGLSELINLRFRGVIASDDDFYGAAGKLGYEKEQAALALMGAQPLIGIGDSVTLWRRNISPQKGEDPMQDLRRMGYNEERIQAIKESSYRLPSVFEYQDIIARQVDNPDQVQKFDLDYLLDETYFANAKANGYDRETALKIYRSYWNLPPFFILASEFKAGTLDEKDFRDLLAFQRFTPYFIDVFVTSLKPKLTQADIKLKYQHGLIGASEIAPELVGIRVSPDLAQELATLWIAEVKVSAPRSPNDGVTSAESIKGETLGLVKTAYKDRVLNKQDATSALLTVGYTQEIIDLTLSIADYELQQSNLKERLAISKELLSAGVSDINTELTSLSGAGATADQLALYQSEFNKILTHKAVTPTLAEFTAWYKKGIISAQDLANGYAIVGVGPTWMPYYLQHAGVDPVTAAALTPQ